ncbi:MAG: serine/threonine protein kinase [Gemmatimonadetes bacterium]|nr:serine/threonine protein kinase [Gemmatimonadota bacterium]
MTQLSDAALDHLRAAVAPAPPALPERYELVGELGRGGMGVVYQVRDRVLHREAALKVMHDALPDRARERLEREANVLAMLEHPGLVPVHDLGTLPDGLPYYVMKLVRGDTLADRLAQGMARGDALRVFCRVCDTVAFAHARGVVHRDLTPRNVMLGTFGDVLVLDWGVAKVGGAEPEPPAIAGVRGGTGEGAVIGTPGFMAPEQHGAARDVDGRSDVFALGRILAEITGEATGPLRSIVARATAADPEARYPDATALSRDVSAFLDRLPVTAHRESIWERVARHAGRHRLALSLIVVYLLVRAVIVLAFRR